MSTKKSASTIILPNPIDVVYLTAESIKERISELLISILGASRQERILAQKFFSSVSLPRFQFNKKKVIQIAVPVVLVAFFFLIGFVLIKKATGTNVAGIATDNPGSVKSTSINREFKFPLKDDRGKQVGQFAFAIKSAELRHKIVVKGQNATSVAGRVFFIVNIQIVNSLNQGLQINTRDYLRISVNGNEKEWFAPDIHNDPVEAQAISTTNSRLALAINDSDRKIKLQVGEIDGTKTVIPIAFNN